MDSSGLEQEAKEEMETWLLTGLLTRRTGSSPVVDQGFSPVGMGSLTPLSPSQREQTLPF